MLKRTKVLKLASILFVFVAFTLSATPAYADTSNPDSAPTVESIAVYRNLLETGDFLVRIYANIPYAVTPDLPVTKTFIWRLIDTDGVTVLGSTVGTNYNDDGYGYNVYSLYFSAAEVASLGIVWETVYTLRLSGNPFAFVTPPNYNFTINVSDYNILTATADVKSALAADIISVATDLDTKWGLANSLLLETETGTVLSIYGETFFRGAIYGVQALAPTAFRFVLKDIEIVSRNWTSNYTDSLDNQWAGTWVQTAKEGSIALLGTGYDLMSIILLLVLCAGIIIANASLVNDSWNGLLDAAFILVVAAKLGVYGLGFLGLLSAISVLYIGSRIWKIPGG